MANSSSRTNGCIEVLRYIFALAIAISHYNAIIRAYIGVEFFFMTAGFFQMKKMSSEKTHPLKYTLKRFLGMAFIYETSILLLSFFGENGMDLKLFLTRMYVCIPDMLGIQLWGMFKPLINPELWFISAMLLAGLFLSLLYSYDRRLFNHALPIIIVLCYAFLRHCCNHLSVTVNTENSALPLGVFRAVGGMSLGCATYVLYEKLMCVPATRKMTLILSAVDLAALGLLFIGITVKSYTSYDFYALFYFPVIIVCAASKRTLWSPVTDRIGQFLNRTLGKHFTLGILCYSAFVIVASPLVINYKSMSVGAETAVFLLVLSAVSYVGSKASDLFERRVLSEIMKKL